MAPVVERRLECVRCRARLVDGHAGLGCTGCGTTYPIVGEVPVVLPQDLSVQHRHQSAYFDAEFERYESYDPENWRLSFVRRIFDALGVGAGAGPYLDVGVGGSGATVIEAARVGVDATGCDLSVEAVAHARHFAVGQGVREQTDFVACAAESLPFADGTFGSASAVAVLEHLDDDASAVSELRRVVRPGGLVWVTVPLAYRYILPPLWPAYLLHDRRIGHKRHYDETSLVRLFETAGFRHVETTYTGHFVKVLQLALGRLSRVSPPWRNRLWWRLERLDLRAVQRPYGALQLNAVFRREPIGGRT
jgi:SAM-dependent methyltransferase